MPFDILKFRRMPEFFLTPQILSNVAADGALVSASAEFVLGARAKRGPGGLRTLQ
jgi:hypothetical protein